MTHAEHRAYIAASAPNSIAMIPRADMLALIDIAIDAERLRVGIQAYLDGDYPNPRQHRPESCGHGIPYYESCEQCIDAHFTAILACRECDAAPGDVCPESATGLSAPCGANNEVVF